VSLIVDGLSFETQIMTEPCVRLFSIQGGQKTNFIICWVLFLLRRYGARNMWQWVLVVCVF